MEMTFLDWRVQGKTATFSPGIPELANALGSPFNVLLFSDKENEWQKH